MLYWVRLSYCFMLPSPRGRYIINIVTGIMSIGEVLALCAIGDEDIILILKYLYLDWRIYIWF